MKRLLRCLGGVGFADPARTRRSAGSRNHQQYRGPTVEHHQPVTAPSSPREPARALAARPPLPLLLCLARVTPAAGPLSDRPGATAPTTTEGAVP